MRAIRTSGSIACSPSWRWRRITGFQVLTKRPERMRDYILSPRRYQRILWKAQDFRVRWPKLARIPVSDPCDSASFWSHVWLGTSVEDQKRANERIPALLETPAAVRFLSVEPLLEAVTIFDLDGPVDVPDGEKSLIDWVIVGGESGPNARPMHPDWVRSIRDQCIATGTAFHFKQWGAYVHANDWRHWLQSKDAVLLCRDGTTVPGNPDLHWTDASVAKLIRLSKKKAGRILDGREWNGMPGRTVA